MESCTNATDPDPRLWRAVVRRDHLSARLSMHTLPAPEGLRDRIDQIWSLEWHQPIPAAANAVISHPTVHLTVEGGDRGEVRHGHALPAALVHGPLTRTFGTDLPEHGWVVGVHLRPGVAGGLLGQSVHELTDRVVGFEEFPALRHLDLSGVYAADDAVHRAAVMHAVAAGLSAPLDRETSLATELSSVIENARDLRSVDELAHRVGMPVRALQRLCRTHFGLTPGWLLRRARILDAHELLTTSDTPVDIADIAHRLGWVDQAHFTRDYTQVTGTPPARQRQQIAADRSPKT